MFCYRTDHERWKKWVCKCFHHKYTHSLLGNDSFHKEKLMDVLWCLTQGKCACHDERGGYPPAEEAIRQPTDGWVYWLLRPLKGHGLMLYITL